MFRSFVYRRIVTEIAKTTKKTTDIGGRRHHYRAAGDADVGREKEGRDLYTAFYHSLKTCMVSTETAREVGSVDRGRDMPSPCRSWPHSEVNLFSFMLIAHIMLTAP